MLRGNKQSGFRHAVLLDEPPPEADTLAACWAGLPRFEKGFTTIDHNQEAPREDTAFALWFDESGLVLLIRADISATGSLRRGAEPDQPDRIKYNDTLEIQVDPTHNHVNYSWFQFDSDGARQAARRSAWQQVLYCDHHLKEEPLAREEWALENQVTREAWYARVRLPLALMGVESAGELTTFGLNIARRRYLDHYLIESAWSPVPLQLQSPWEFGEALMPGAPIRIAELDFGELFQDWNELRLTLHNLTGQVREAEVGLRVWCQDHDERPSCRVTIPPGGTAPAALRFRFHSREWKRQELELSVKEKGREVYRALFSACHTVSTGQGCMIMKHGARWFEGPPPGKPAPDDPEFPRRMRRYILSCLPDFPEMGWWGGAKGDWIMRDRRGTGIEFNLLAANIHAELGDMIAGLFERDDERVAAVALLVHRLVIYTYLGNQVQQCLSPADSVRHLATICGGFACIALGILAATPRADGGRGYRAWHASVKNHVILAVELNGYRTMVDPTLGGIHYTRDHRRLASEDELLADPAISAETLSGREDDYNVRRDHYFYGSLPYLPRTGWTPGDCQQENRGGTCKTSR